jgi:hypothetical protein
MEQEKILVWGLKRRKKPSEPKTEFGAQNQYGRVIYTERIKPFFLKRLS